MTASGIPALLEPIQERLNAATPGPWELLGGGEWISPIGIAVAPDDGGVGPKDAVFIAHAPTDTARLLAAVKAVVELAEEWRYKGEFGWGAWQEGHGPDPEGAALDNASSRIRSAVEAALRGEA